MRHRRMLAPINTIKHYVHRSNTTTTSGNVAAVVVADAVVAPATTNAFDVKEGSIIKAIYFELWALSIASTGVTNSFTLIIEKVPSNLASVTAAQIVNLGAYTNKKNILYTTQGVSGAAIDGNNALPVSRFWLKIPKGKQRMGLGDRIVMSFASVGASYNTCGVSTYKEYI